MREHLLRQGHLQKMSLLPAGCCILHKSYTPLWLIIYMFYHSDFLGLSFPSGIKWLHIGLPSPVTSTTGCYFCFGSIPSFFLESVLHWSPVAYWAPTDLGSSFFSVLSFCLFILFMGFSRQEYWSGLPFPSPMDHVLSELFTMTCPSWVALHGMAHSFIELDKAVCDQIGLSSVAVVFSLSALWWRRTKGLWKLPDGRDWLKGKLGLVLMLGPWIKANWKWSNRRWQEWTLTDFRNQQTKMDRNVWI